MSTSQAGLNLGAHSLPDVQYEGFETSPYEQEMAAEDFGLQVRKLDSLNRNY